MNTDEENTSSDSVRTKSYNDLSPVDKKFADEMLKRAIEVCNLLGLCTECGADLGNCEHSKRV